MHCFRWAEIRLLRRGREADVLNQQAGLLASIYCVIFLGKTLYFPITILRLIVLIVTIKLFAVLFLGKTFYFLNTILRLRVLIVTKKLLGILDEMLEEVAFAKLPVASCYWNREKLKQCEGAIRYSA